MSDLFLEFRLLPNVNDRLSRGVSIGCPQGPGPRETWREEEAAYAPEARARVAGWLPGWHQ